MATSVDATQRKLIVGIVTATHDDMGHRNRRLGDGGHPDRPTLRAAALCRWRLAIPYRR
jgi:hypothetical protein